MRKILVLNSKGGCGKTTVATNLACAYANNGFVTALLDYDPQGSATRWLSVRSEKHAVIHGVVAHQRHARPVTRSWQLRLPPGTERVIVDAPAGISGQHLREYLRDVDRVLVPVLPSPIDIHAVSRFIEDLLLEGKVRQQGVRLAVLANRVKENTRVYQSLEKFLATLRLPFIARLRDTQNYVHAAERGMGIHEMWDSRVGKDKTQWAPLLDWLESDSDKTSVRRACSD